MTETHQPIPVHGYKPQDQTTVDLVNEGKELEERVLRYLEKVQRTLLTSQPETGRWLAIGRTDIQKGFMAVFRSVFNPSRVRLPEDE